MTPTRRSSASGLVARNAKLLADHDELGLIHFVTPGEYKTYAGSAGSGAVASAPTTR